MYNGKEDMHKMRLVLKIYNEMFCVLDSATETFGTLHVSRKGTSGSLASTRIPSSRDMQPPSSRHMGSSIPALLLKIEESENAILESQREKMMILNENQEMLNKLRTEEAKYRELMKEMSLKSAKMQELEEDILKLSHSQLEKTEDVAAIERQRDDFKEMLVKVELEKSNLLVNLKQDRTCENLESRVEMLENARSDLLDKLSVKQDELDRKHGDIANFQKERKKYSKNYKKMEQINRTNETNLTIIRKENVRLKKSLGKLKADSETRIEGIYALIGELQMLGVGREKIRRIVPQNVEIKNWGSEEQTGDSLDESFRQEMKEVEIEVEIDRKMKMLGGGDQGMGELSIEQNLENLDLESLDMSSGVEGSEFVIVILLSCYLVILLSCYLVIVCVMFFGESLFCV